MSLINLARGLKLVALLFFLLPWVTVSCADQTLISMSGVDLATGSITAHNPITGEAGHPPGSGDPDWPVLIGALLIAGAFLLGFLLPRAQAAIVSIAALAGAAALIGYSVLIRLPARIHADSSSQIVQGMNRGEFEHLIRVGTAPGFWLTLAALAAAIIASWMARSQAP